jgi:hypothetical protein
MDETFCTIVSQNGEIMCLGCKGDAKRYGSLETKSDNFVCAFFGVAVCVRELFKISGTKKADKG